MANRIGVIADDVGRRLNWALERFCALLLAALVLVIWFEVLQRYALHLGYTWGEELSRYLMIWMALMAVPCGAYRREHIGLEIVSSRLSPGRRRGLGLAMDCLGLAFFLFLLVYGLGMVGQGRSQYATIFGMTMVVPFAAVPACGLLTAVQILVTMLRDIPARGEGRTP
jgi:TRAP-type C4-dicarboxylate transport system permease small subunit